MASPFVAAAAQACKNSQSSSKNSSSSSSPRTIKRAWSSNESSYAAVAPPKSCVCAPSTHAGSFKCRLHRVNSQVPSSPPATPQPAVSSSSTRTVEAQ